MDHEPLTPERYRRGGRQMYWVATGFLGVAGSAMAVAGYGGTHGYSTRTVVANLVAACLLAAMATWTAWLSGYAEGRARGMTRPEGTTEPPDVVR